MYILAPQTVDFNEKNKPDQRGNLEIFVPSGKKSKQWTLNDSSHRERIFQKLITIPVTFQLKLMKWWFSDDRESITYLPPYKIPRFHFHIGVYFYGLCCYLFEDMSLRAAAACTRKQFGYTDRFCHTTLMRFKDSLAELVVAYPILDEMLFRIWPTEPMKPELLADYMLKARVKVPKERKRSKDALRELFKAFAPFETKDPLENLLKACETLALSFFTMYHRFLI